MDVSIYLFFNGNCLEAMQFYAETLGGEITGVFRNGDAPKENRMPGGDDLIMNMALKVDNMTIMASDAPGDWYSKPQGFDVVASPKSLSEAERVFAALSDGAEEVRQELSETFWAERFAMLTDRYGTRWMVNYTGSKAQG